jgi:hypothetical protein
MAAYDPRVFSHIRVYMWKRFGAPGGSSDKWFVKFIAEGPTRHLTLVQKLYVVEYIKRHKVNLNKDEKKKLAKDFHRDLGRWMREGLATPEMPKKKPTKK